MGTKNKNSQDTSLDTLLQRAGQEEVAARESDGAASDHTQDAGDGQAADVETAAGESAQKSQRDERDERARRAFRHLTDIDEEGESNFSVRGFVGGDILASPSFRRQLWYVLMLSAMALLYIGNRYSYQQELIRRQELSKELADRKFKVLTITSELTEYSMRSNIEENLIDSTLQTSTKSSYYLPVASSEMED